MNYLTLNRKHRSMPRWVGRSCRAIGLINILVLPLIALAAALFSALPARAEASAAQQSQLMTLDEVKSGSLLLKSSEPGRYVEATRVATDVDIVVSGPTARARITQIFTNPSNGWVEAVYAYPLPEDSAVHGLKMVVGKRVIVGNIKERQEAKAIYETAKAQGQKASLVEQERPNLFTNSVANIGPHEQVVVQIDFQEPIRLSSDIFSLRVPLVVAPRYNPAPLTQSADISANGIGWGSASDPVPDRDKITAPVLDPRLNAPVNPVSIKVRLQAGFALGEVKSRHHTVKTESLNDQTQVITLADNAHADRDFELTWTPKDSKAPAVGLFREHVGKDDFALAYITPPVIEQEKDIRPREIVFVIDNSGSMGGSSMDQAKASLDYALSRLKSADRFNVIRFDDTMDLLFNDTVSANSENTSKARAFVNNLQASGGTEMLEPLRAALNDPRPAEQSFIRQIVFLTDGAIGNEQQLLDAIAAKRGRSRVFMVGIGSAPNNYLMNRAAELGRGSFTSIGSGEEVNDRMRDLFAKLENPVVTNLVAKFSSGNADMTPATLPDLYRGEPLVIAAKLGAPSGTLTVKGMIGRQPWEMTVPLANAATGEGLSKLWARRKISDAEVESTLGTITTDEANKHILNLALEHGLVTRLTSLVAVDKTPSRDADKPLTRSDVPLNLPAGWDFDKVFGEQTLRKADMESSGVEQIAYSQKPVLVENAPAQLPLPQTATDAELRMLGGLLILLASAGLLLFNRKSGRNAS
ncbi:marine proteobacterial sortase target protein [Phyllobacterium sp. YR531]|uniref:marine proteobacterial sortase target protein n=1 Tax=Phyllobacterium sp. YR531 TaxID=1144343 RepID=UPI00026FCCBD|nr:marine proteobacterial sortase target protein [Phyllobacterium sp. YR531]EJM99503.1 marine proteobacterial sortase target protein [Phyllobacterium sp. YR531]